MRRNLILIFSAILLATSCNAKDKAENRTEETTINETTKDMTDNKKKVVNLTKADFLAKVANFEANPEWKYLGDKPAIVDFYADWCGPCKVIAPILEELAGEYAGEIYVYKVDTEKEEELAALFGIRSIPSLLFIPMSGEPQMAQGAAPKQNLKEAIDNFLLSKEQK